MARTTRSKHHDDDEFMVKTSLEVQEKGSLVEEAAENSLDNNREDSNISNDESSNEGGKEPTKPFIEESYDNETTEQSDIVKCPEQENGNLVTGERSVNNSGNKISMIDENETKTNEEKDTKTDDEEDLNTNEIIAADTIRVTPTSKKETITDDERELMTETPSPIQESMDIETEASNDTEDDNDNGSEMIESWDLIKVYSILELQRKGRPMKCSEKNCNLRAAVQYKSASKAVWQGCLDCQVSI